MKLTIVRFIVYFWDAIIDGMKKNIIIISTVLLVLIGGGVFVFSRQANAPENEGSAGSSASGKESSVSENTNITATEVATHSSESDCWTIIGNSVYDITSYIPRHPGGDEILKACGTDGTSLFEERKDSNGNQVGSGTPHSSVAAGQLEAFKVGNLAN